MKSLLYADGKSFVYTVHDLKQKRNGFLLVYADKVNSVDLCDLAK